MLTRILKLEEVAAARLLVLSLEDCPRKINNMLSSTLHSYFAGERGLFEGLKIMELEEEWKRYPVLHFDLSGARHPTNRTAAASCW